MEVRKRRTQQERRDATVRTLIAAATEALIEEGYAAASVQRICARTHLSQGALFRQFPTREALMVAVGEDVGAQLLERYRKRFGTLQKNGGTDVPTAMKLLRDTCRSRLNMAWYELVTAARTNENLRKQLEPMARRYFDSITRLARELLPDVAAAMGERFDVLVGMTIAMFDGESMHRAVVRDARVEDRRIELLADAVAMLAGKTDATGRPEVRKRVVTGRGG
jgi:AcrR family transcriptional regulator